MEFPSRTDIVTAMNNPKICYKANELVGGDIQRKGTRIVQYAGGYTTVFPFKTIRGEEVAVRCWCADIGNARQRSAAISDYLSKEQNPYFVNFEYVHDAVLIKGDLYPVIVMEWVDGKTLKEHINENTNTSSILQLADKFKLMVEELHKRNIAHGDLQHGNIMVKADGSLVLVDYDSMYIEKLNGMPDIIKGLPGYQHPARNKNQYVNHKLDYFSELIIYLSLLIFAERPQLWQCYFETEDLLFTKDDFVNIKSSWLYKEFCNSSNAAISNLVKKLEESLNATDIQNLLPLEEQLVGKWKKTMDDIFGKMDKQPNPPEKTVYVLPDVNSIISRF